MTEIDTGVLNLTKINWNQPLVASIRYAIYKSDITTGYPVTDTGEPVDDEDLKHLTKGRDFSKLSAITAQEQSNAYRFVRVAPAPRDKYTPDVDVFRQVVDRSKAFHAEIGSPSRSGAILAVALTELHWPVNFIIKILNTSRPTVSKWIFMHQDDEITDKEIQALNNAFVVDEMKDYIVDSGFTYLFDLRTIAFKSKRTGLQFKKAVFLPSKEIAVVMRALWRVAYRVRGAKSSVEARNCAQTLDIIIELLLRRGVTALNISRILGIQHMAVTQRSKKSFDWFGSAEQLMVSGLAGVSNGSDLSERTKKYTVYDDLGDWYARAILFQTRTAHPTDSSPMPYPNVSVLAKKSLTDLKTLDSLPVYAVPNYIDSIDEGYSVTYPLMNHKYQCETADDSYKIDDSVQALYFDAMKYRSLDIVRPDSFTGEVLTEQMLLQATMTYDRNKYLSGYGKTTYHWVTVTALRLIHIFVDMTKEEVATYVEQIDDFESSFNYYDFEDAIFDFFPETHVDLISTWMTETEPDNEGISLLKQCFTTPSDILATYGPPIARGVASGE